MSDLVFVLVTWCPSPSWRSPCGGRAVVSVENVVGLVLGVLLTVFLVVALLFPERF